MSARVTFLWNNFERTGLNIFNDVTFPINSRLRDIPQSHRLSLKPFITELKHCFWYCHSIIINIAMRCYYRWYYWYYSRCCVTIVSPLLFIATVTITITIATITIIIVTVIILLNCCRCSYIIPSFFIVTNYRRYTYVVAIRARFRLQHANTILTFLLLGMALFELS